MAKPGSREGPFGARDIVIAVATVAGPATRTALWMGAVCDSLDAASAMIAGAKGKNDGWVRAASALPIVFALGGVLTGVRWSAVRSDNALPR